MFKSFHQSIRRFQVSSLKNLRRKECSNIAETGTTLAASQPNASWMQDSQLSEGTNQIADIPVQLSSFINQFPLIELPMRLNSLSAALLTLPLYQFKGCLASLINKLSLIALNFSDSLQSINTKGLQSHQTIGSLLSSFTDQFVVESLLKCLSLLYFEVNSCNVAEATINIMNLVKTIINKSFECHSLSQRASKYGINGSFIESVWKWRALCLHLLQNMTGGQGHHGYSVQILLMLQSMACNHGGCTREEIVLVSTVLANCADQLIMAISSINELKYREDSQSLYCAEESLIELVNTFISSENSEVLDNLCILLTGVIEHTSSHIYTVSIDAETLAALTSQLLHAVAIHAVDFNNKTANSDITHQSHEDTITFENIGLLMSALTRAEAAFLQCLDDGVLVSIVHILKFLLTKSSPKIAHSQSFLEVSKMIVDNLGAKSHLQLLCHSLIDSIFKRWQEQQSLSCHAFMSFVTSCLNIAPDFLAARYADELILLLAHLDMPNETNLQGYVDYFDLTEFVLFRLVLISASDLGSEKNHSNSYCQEQSRYNQLQWTPSHWTLRPSCFHYLQQIRQLQERLDIIIDFLTGNTKFTGYSSQSPQYVTLETSIKRAERIITVLSQVMNLEHDFY